ncbi:ribonuclease H-like domain-containing protein [Tanacetum coccineum]
MAGDDSIPPKPHTPNEKPFGITNIKTYIPLVLDLNELNYDSNDRATKEWGKLDSLVKLWIFGTISKSLLQRVLKKNVSAHDVWKSLNEVCGDNLVTEDPLNHQHFLANLCYTGGVGVTIGPLVNLLVTPLRHHHTYVHTNPTSAAARNGNENNNNHGSASQWNNTTGRIMHGARVTFSPTRPTKMGYAPQPSLAPRQAHFLQPVVPLGLTGLVVFIPFGPSTYTTSSLRGTWGPQVVYGPYVDQATILPQAFSAMTVQDYGDSGWTYGPATCSSICNSNKDLYHVLPTTSSPIVLLSTNQSVWHQRLGHPGHIVIGKDVRLPFLLSNSRVENMFDIVHSDIWTSPIPSVSDFKYYVLFLDHFSYFLWVYPLRKKSGVFDM